MIDFLDKLNFQLCELHERDIEGGEVVSLIRRMTLSYTLSD